MSELVKNQQNLFIKPILAAICILIVIALASFFFENPIHTRAMMIAGICLVLWLSEIVPPYVPTFVLWALTAALLAPLSKDFALGEILKWSANPVLLLFFGGFSFGVAASRYDIDKYLAKLAVRFARGRNWRLLVLTVSATALMSMWMSNIAAAAMMITALHPLIGKLDKENSLRRALLMAVAVGANFGGMATPIGTGPNAIAISAVEAKHHITFVEWMSFAVPLTIGLLIAGTLAVKFIYKVQGEFDGVTEKMPRLSGQGRAVVLIFALTILAWLTEPLHGVSSAVTALLSAAVLFGSNLLTRKDLSAIDWGTIALIAGGIGLGMLFEKAGLVEFWASKISWSALPIFAQAFILCFVSAFLSALMSNTATVTLLIPFALSFIPNPAIAVLIAISASLGTPFIISTPINAMVHGEGGLTAKDFFVIGFPLMILGSFLLALTGFYVLSFWF